MAFNQRITRKQSSRSLTCLEAVEEGFPFVLRCSGCDYYVNNRPLNAIAMKKERHELSRFWQCTKLHNYGELSAALRDKTPYQPVKPSRYNCVSMIDAGVGSSAKRVRLFSPPPMESEAILTPPTLPAAVAAVPVENTSGTSGQNPVMEMYKLKLDFEKAVRDYRKAILERDSALEEVAAVKSQLIEAKRSQDAAVADKEKALSDLDAVLAKYNRDIGGVRTPWKEKFLEEEKKCLELKKEIAQVEHTNSKLNALLTTLSKEQSSLNARVHALETRAETKVANRAAIAKFPITAVVNLTSKMFPDVNPRDRLQSLFDLLYGNRKSFRKHVNSKVRDSMMDSVRLQCCRDIKKYYSGWQFLKALDCSSQSLNQECYKMIYSVQKPFPKWAKILPEVKHIQRAEYSLNAHLNEIIPIVVEGDGRESARFDYRSYTDYLLSKFGLLDIIMDATTEKPVVVAVTLDGAKLSKFLSHVTAGFKLVDPRCINPLTGDLLFGDSGSAKVQSHAHCYPIHIVMAKDNKELYRTEFAAFFQFLREYEEEHGFRIKFAFPQDMSSIWKTTGRGGTARVKTFPCYCCSVTSATLIAPQPKSKCFRVDRCKQPKCYHHDMLTQETFDAWAEQKTELENQYPYLLRPAEVRSSQVILSSVDELRDENNPFDIDFRPRTIEQGRQFDDFITRELRLRMLAWEGTVSEKRQRLKDALQHETIYNLMVKLVGATDNESRFCEVDDAVPCIMHGGNRMGEKLFMLVLTEAWENCTTTREREVLIAAVEHYINTGVFGNIESQSQWKLPVTKDFELETVTFSAWRVKKVISRLGDLADKLLSQQNADRAIRWRNMLQKYIGIMKVAFQHQDFSDEDIESFQDSVDEWFYIYVELVGIQGITNYIHLLGAGHLYHYLKRWRNLYRYQQQGWEKKNGVIASFVNRRTRRGGAGGKHGPAHTSRVLPVMKWFQRTSAWATGDAQAFFQ
jgi:hypothetical protein